MIRAIGLEATPATAPTELHAFLLRSLKDQWRDYRKDFARCRKKFSKKSVHQFRVESRRLLSTMSILAAVMPGKPLKAASRALKKRLRIFARLRDTHVQLQAVEELEPDFPELKAFRRALTKRKRRLTQCVVRKFKHTGLRKVAQPIAAIRNKLRLLVQDHEREKRNPRAVEETREEAFARVAERFRAIDPADPVTIHRTRVAFKKFRYMMEALQPILPGVNDRMIERMHEYQSRMGDIQDATVLRSSLEKFLRKHQGRVADATRIRAKLERRRAALISSFMNEANELFDFAPLPHRRPTASPSRTTSEPAK